MMTSTDKNKIVVVTEKKQYAWSEKILLINLIEEYKSVIENKKTDGTTLKAKQEIWNKIAHLYNASASTKRNVKQLKKLWDNIKQKTRKADSSRTNYTLQTGGGPPQEDDKDDPIYERVRAIVPTISLESENQYDNVAVFEEDNSKETTKTPEPLNLDHDYTFNNVPDKNQIEKVHKEHNHENVSLPQKSKGVKRRKFYSNLSKSKGNFIEEEALLRIQKVRASIKQQEEFHILKMEIANLEKKYWQKKILLLKD